MAKLNWACPFCHTRQTVSVSKAHHSLHNIEVGETSYSGAIAGAILAIGCSNSECKKVELSFSLGTIRSKNSYGEATAINEIIKTKIWPESVAKPQPDYIPAGIVQDYYEAARIVELSPKAASTLARRCIQGMIRDFCGIAKPTLNQEINELKKQFDAGHAPRGVSEESFEAIEAIRKIGNIGAHMEKDINVIVDVEPDEAALMLGLVENLLEDWYISRQKRQERLARVTASVEQKDAVRKSPSE
ncbi:MAG: DUF4145 domain-containing protein [Agrobacterium albertimagni]